jgi:hypothetical protein
MTPTERTNNLAALNNRARWDFMNYFWTTPALSSISAFGDGHFDPNFVFPGPYSSKYPLCCKMGSSHGWINTQNLGSLCALATCSDATNDAMFLSLYANYVLADGTPYGASGINQGRSYAWFQTFSLGVVEANILLDTTFPAVGFHNNPALARLGEWWQRIQPAGRSDFDGDNEQWGDIGFLTGDQFFVYPQSARAMSFLLDSPYLAEVQPQAETIYGTTGSGLLWNDMLYPYFYATPSPATNPVLGYCDQREGWTFGSSGSPNATAGFYSGTGFGMMSRPRGSELGHSAIADLDFFIWAYGANITAGPMGDFVCARDSTMHNTIAVNGNGQAETEAQPAIPVVSSVQAFTNAPDYVYVAADATQAYPHYTFPDEPQYDEGDEDHNGPPYGYDVGFAWPYLLNYRLAPYTLESTNITAVHREILFNHHQYYVIFDTLSANQPLTWSWIYHCGGDAILMSRNNGSFTYRTPITAGESVSSTAFVTNYVFQATSPSEYYVTTVNDDISGTNGYTNPIQHIGYYPSATTDNQDGFWKAYSASFWETSASVNNFHFLTVIFPVNPVAPGIGAPTFTNLDDSTVEVSYEGTNDVIGFDSETTNISRVTFLVNSSGLWSSP